MNKNMISKIIATTLLCSPLALAETLADYNLVVNIPAGTDFTAAYRAAAGNDGKGRNRENVASEGFAGFRVILSFLSDANDGREIAQGSKVLEETAFRQLFSSWPEAKRTLYMSKKEIADRGFQLTEDVSFSFKVNDLDFVAADAIGDEVAFGPENIDKVVAVLVSDDESAIKKNNGFDRVSKNYKVVDFINVVNNTIHESALSKDSFPVAFVNINQAANKLEPRDGFVLDINSVFNNDLPWEGTEVKFAVADYPELKNMPVGNQDPVPIKLNSQSDSEGSAPFPAFGFYLWSPVGSTDLENISISREQGQIEREFVAWEEISDAPTTLYLENKDAENIAAIVFNNYRNSASLWDVALADNIELIVPDNSLYFINKNIETTIGGE